jgi:ATP-binding cassette subfamily B protein
LAKILKYLKPYAWIIVLCVALIFAQAMADLKLPDMMSDIVDTGISNGGIDSPVTEVLSRETHAFLTGGNYEILDADGARTPLLTDAERAAVSANYAETKIADLPNSVKIAEDADGETRVYVRRDIADKNYKITDADALGRAAEKGFLFLLAADGVETVLLGGEGAAAGAGVPAVAVQIEELQSALGALATAEPDFRNALKTYGLLAALEKENFPKHAALFLTTGAGEAPAVIPALYSYLAGTDFAANMAVLRARTELAAAGLDADKIQSDYILNRGLLMLLVALGSAVCAVAIGYFAAQVAAKLARDLRRKLFQRVESFSNHELDRFTTASIITRSTNDVTQIQQLVMIMIKMVFYAPMMGLGAVYYAATKAPIELTVVNFVSVLILVLTVVVLFFIAVPRFNLVQKLTDRLNLVTRENLSGMMVIRAFNKQKKEAARFDETNRDLTKVNLFINRAMTALMPAMMLLMNGLTIAVMWVGSEMITVNSLNVGGLMAFIQYAMQIVMSFLMISVMFIMIPRAAVAAKRIAEILDTEPSISDGERTLSLGGRAKGALTFEKVSFRYDGAEENALTDISFTAEPNKVFAIIGTTGAGKTTIVNLIPRFYDVTNGRIMLDGRDIRDLSLRELRDNVAVVAQKSLLFSGSVAYNLRLADASATDDAMYAALETAQISGFVKDADGLDTGVAQGGANVSGGQKQRLSIARSLVKDASVLIFDDSFSALDFKTDAKLRAALKRNLKDKAVIIIAQRIGTIKDADEILVLDDGKTAGKGTHKELMKSCEAYREIAFSQLSTEELV